MWSALGDLTNDPSCYERAWELSGRRFARAKRSLGRHAFRQDDYEVRVSKRAFLGPCKALISCMYRGRYGISKTLWRSSRSCLIYGSSWVSAA
jgi:hypothetical protein